MGEKSEGLENGGGQLDQSLITVRDGKVIAIKLLGAEDGVEGDCLLGGK